jgi:hypothetical protein
MDCITHSLGHTIAVSNRNRHAITDSDQYADASHAAGHRERTAQFAGRPKPGV